MKTKVFFLTFILILSCTGKTVKRNTSFTAETPAQQPMRPQGPPPDFEEMRRQRNITRAANIEWIKANTKKYSPDTWNLLIQYNALPEANNVPADGNGVASTKKNDETFQYLRGRTKSDMLTSMEKNVHEIAHAFFDQNAFMHITQNNLSFQSGNTHGYIYVSPTQGYYLSFPLKAMFPSRELEDVIPKDLRTFRFNTYIQGSTSTQSEGIIGLLNELHAYYLGSKYCYEMLEPYKIATGSDAQGLFDWVTNTQSTMSAYYEFDYFMLEYLSLMKAKYPDNYNLLISYVPFREAYRDVRNSYKGLINKYTDRIRSEMKHLNSSKGVSAKMEKGWLWIKPEKSNVASGSPLFSNPREKLLPILESRKYRDIENDLDLR